MKLSELNAREGKSLRFIVDTYKHQLKPVEPHELIIHMEWSDLPHTPLQARYTCESLRQRKLIQRRGRAYEPTERGKRLAARANAQRRWMS